MQVHVSSCEAPREAKRTNDATLELSVVEVVAHSVPVRNSKHKTRRERAANGGEGDEAVVTGLARNRFFAGAESKGVCE